MTNLINSSEIINFEYFLYSVSFILMPLSKKITNKYISDDGTNRKIHQYTHWNLLMVVINNILTNCFNYDNKLICKFIGFNSLNIMILFHLLLLYDLGYLYTFNKQVSLIKYLFPNNISEITLLKIEYTIGNVIVHILPVYYYKDYIMNYYYIYNNVNISYYIIFFKCSWLLNIVGNFNPSKLYNPNINISDKYIINFIAFFTIILDKSLLYLSM